MQERRRRSHETRRHVVDREECERDHGATGA